MRVRRRSRSASARAQPSESILGAALRADEHRDVRPLELELALHLRNDARPPAFRLVEPQPAALRAPHVRSSRHDDAVNAYSGRTTRMAYVSVAVGGSRLSMISKLLPPATIVAPACQSGSAV
jgi:hypothetical protein